MWENLTPYDLYGVAPSVQPTAWDQLPAIAKDDPAQHGATAPLWSPDNPLFWVGGLLLAVFGLAGAATSVRLGPARAGFAVGKT